MPNSKTRADKIHKNGSILRVLFPVFFLAVVMAGCSTSSASDTTGAAPEQQIKTVKTEKIGRVQWNGTVEQSADVLPSLQLDVVLKVDGDVLNVFKERGERVQKDEPIIEIDKTDILRQKERIESALKAAQEQYDKAGKDLADTRMELDHNISKTELALSDIEKEYSKMQNDYDHGLVTEHDLEAMETKVKNIRLDLEILKRKKTTLDTTNPLSAAEHQLKSSQVEYEDLENLLADYDVKAPISGTLIEMNVEEAMTLPRGYKVGVVQQLDPVKIETEITEDHLALVQDKSTIPFYIPGTSEMLSGTVTFLSDVADLQTKTYTLELEADNSNGKLKVGSRVQLLFSESGEREVLAIPADSILTEDGQAYVFVVAGNLAEKRQVALGRRQGDWQEVTRGVEENDILIVSGQHSLQDQEKINISAE